MTQILIVDKKEFVHDIAVEIVAAMMDVDITKLGVYDVLQEPE